jgi:DNA-binding NtrC family response regulator
MSEEPSRILIVDDEFSVRDSLTHWFETDGYLVGSAGSANEALKKLDTAPWDLALVDIKMPGMDGIALQQRLHEVAPQLLVVIITAYGSVESAVRALKQGAYDYVTKPIDPDELSRVVRKALEHRRLAVENQQLRQRLDEIAGVDEMVGKTRGIERVKALIAQVADTDVTVLIQGESGTGKEIVARAIHAGGRRRYFPLVPVHCAALPDSLLESELFGHEKGAFTGAQYQRKGKLELADGGTLFLDEIATISHKTQVDLLRVLETRQFTRLGGNRQVSSDFRVICATNEQLERLVEEGTFRRDLFFRVNVFPIVIPPLRDRVDDIPLLVDHFVRKYALQMDRDIQGVSEAALEALCKERWPGNVRQLENAIERAMVVGQGEQIEVADLPFNQPRTTVEPSGDTLADMERSHIIRILERTEWNISQSARILQIDRATLYNKIRKYGLRG